MARVVTFLSDFGLDGAAGICKAVMLSIAPELPIVDISHVVRKFAVRDGAWVLWSAAPWLPVGVHLAVVDPGVGTARRPIAIRVARGDVLVGPDNGLLRPASERLGGIAEARALDNPAWRLPEASHTFHGRDVFAPAAARLAQGEPFADAGPVLAADSLVDLAFPRPVVEPGRLAASVLYVDTFGNLRLTGGVSELVAALGDVAPGAALAIELDGRPVGTSARRHVVRWSRTFGEVPAGGLLAYEDSSGNLAVAVAEGDAAARLSAAVDARIGITRA